MDTGAQKEVDQWPLFLELAVLLPRTRLRLVFTGPDVPLRLDGSQCSFPTLSPQPATSEPARGGASNAQARAQPLDGHEHRDSTQPSMPSADRGAEHSSRMPPRDGVAVGSMQLCFRRGMGHDVLPVIVAELGRIDMVFGPNAGEFRCITYLQLANVCRLRTRVT